MANEPRVSNDRLKTLQYVSESLRKHGPVTTGNELADLAEDLIDARQRIAELERDLDFAQTEVSRLTLALVALSPMEESRTMSSTSIDRLLEMEDEGLLI